MNIFNLLKRSVNIDSAVAHGGTSGVKSGGGSAGASFRERIVPTHSEELSLTVAAVYRAAELRANSIAALRMRYLVRDISRNYLREAAGAEGSRINYVVGVRPNSRQNGFQFWKAVEMARMFEGHCYVYPVWGDSGELLELIPVHGTWNKFTNTYTISEPDFGINSKVVTAGEIIVLRGIATRQHPEGESIIRYASRAMSVSATSEALALESAAKGGRQKLLLQQKEDPSGVGIGGVPPEELEEERQRVQDSLRDDDVVLLDGLVQATPYNLSLVDLQLLETRKFSVSDIARFFGVPRTLLMDDTNSNYKSAESASLEFMTRTLQPLIREIEDEFDAKLLTMGEYATRRFRFDTSALFALDITTKNAYNKSRLETGLASINELRAEANMPSVDGGDDHYVSCNVTPIGGTGQAKQKPQSKEEV